MATYQSVANLTPLRGAPKPRRVLEIVRSLSAGTADSVAVTKRIDLLPGVVSVAIADRKSKIENHAAGVVQW
jgi:hypothetical protein